MSIRYYQEIETGDYLAVDTDTNEYYRKNFGKDFFESRATAIAEQVGSVCTTNVSRSYLQEKCRPVAKQDVPEEWLRAIAL